MLICLEHPVVYCCKVWKELLFECLTLSSFCGKIEKFARKIVKSQEVTNSNIFTVKKPDEWTGKSATDLSYKFKGDVFEVFCECLIRLCPIDDRIGIADYRVITEDDTGVDGYGTGREGDPVTVQIKYRLWDYELDHTKEHLDNFRYTSFTKFGVNPKLYGRMLILTTGLGMNWQTADVQFGGKARCISRKASYGCLYGAQYKTIDSLFSLERLVDGNVVFWREFYNAVSKGARRVKKHFLP